MRVRWIAVPMLVATVVGIGLLDAHLRGELVQPEPPPDREPPAIVPPQEIALADASAEPARTQNAPAKTRAELRAELDAELAAQVPAPPPPVRRMLGVRVVDTDGRPVPGALVRSSHVPGQRAESRTGQDGETAFADVPAGAHELAVFAGRTSVLRQGGELATTVTTSGAATQVTLTVTAPLSYVEATVTDAITGTPLVDARVELRQAGAGQPLQFLRTDAQGRARAVVPPLARYELSASLTIGRGSTRITGPVLIGTTARVAIPIRPFGSITGTVTDTAGAPVRWAYVWAIPASPPGLAELPWSELAKKLASPTWRVRRAAADVKGRYALHGLDVHGVYHLVAQVPHALDSRVRRDVSVRRGDTEIDLTVPRTRPLTVVVFAAGGKTLKGTTVRVKTPRRGWLDAEPLGHGSYRFLGLTDGGHTLAVDAPGHQLVRRYLEFPQDDVEALRIDLK